MGYLIGIIFIIAAAICAHRGEDVMAAGYSIAYAILYAGQYIGDKVDDLNAWKRAMKKAKQLSDEVKKQDQKG